MDFALSSFCKPLASPKSLAVGLNLDRSLINFRSSNNISTSRAKKGQALIVMAQKKKKKKPKIEGLSEEMNSIASEDLTFAPARRRVRFAFSDLQQQLDHVLFKMAPSGIRTDEWYEINRNGEDIFCKSWLPEPGVQIKGVLCFCHGYGDTCTFFFEGIARHIAAAGYAVYAIDHPGFGLSGGLHGYVPSFDGVVDNVIELYKIMKGRPEMVGLPRFLFGQSMGGAIALKALLKDPNEWDGIVLVAPMCKIAEEMTPPVPLQKVLILLSNIVPEAKLVPQKDLAELAFREADKRKLADYNVICYSDQTRLKTAVELLNATKFIESQVDKVASPMLILHGAADKVTDPRVSQFLYEKASSKDKTLKLYDGSYHCILEGEPDDRILEVLSDIISWLDSRCGRYYDYRNVKTCLTLAISRIKLLQNKRDGQLKLMRKEIAQFLQAGQEPIARIRVEHVIREQNTWAAYEILEMFCEFVLARVPILESQRECPSELREAVASIIFAAPRCSDLPDLLHVKNLFAAKYGKEFVAAASELRPDTSVNRTIIEKLSPIAPSAEVKLNVLKEIAREYNINWDSSKTEAEFGKKPEDLLNGPKQIAPPTISIPESNSQKQSPVLEHSMPNSRAQRDHLHQSPTASKNSSPVALDKSKSLTKDHNTKPSTEAKDTGPQSSDALDKARAAIAAAERASAAARAAAELVNSNFSRTNLGPRS
ncbi:OLC1v1032272C1 [Oldenlandia corymbosa var. corymbosa]|uniref:OLC1v1032272C1 n=1 Tax=Oldenlandia corymbosa var. corymbosa TaxID=529605 RepID=A0AAV1CL93_OLDCO|nr:OLC1v1032272C1 [Oldenlandia corymbosa var. corymbosa]